MLFRSALPESLPLGQKQRLQLAVALIHKPDLLLLDEPTSGVDPVARDVFWEHLIELSRKDKVTIFITTHFMNEALHCDRISLMNAGKLLVVDTPAGVTESRHAATLSDAFIGYLEDAQKAQGDTPPAAQDMATETGAAAGPGPGRINSWFSLQRLLAVSYREQLELRRDPIRLTLAILGSVILMLVMGYGITLDVEHLTFAVLDRDQTTVSREYTIGMAGTTRYFTEQPPLADYEELDRRMRSGELSMALEIPPDFGKNLEAGRPVRIGVWIDGSMPARAEIIQGYVQGNHLLWLKDTAQHRLGQRAQLGVGQRQLVLPANIELRYRYNPDVKSLWAMVPAVIPILLLIIPAGLATLAVVREKDLGSIVNFYVTPTTRLEFLLGKQLPYVVLGMINFLMLTLLAVTLFNVPMKGDFWTAAVGALLYVACSTSIGLFASTLTRTQVSAVFLTAILTLVPAAHYSGIVDPVSSLEGFGRLVGDVYPTTYFITISRGTYSKALGFAGLYASFIPLLIAIPVLHGLSVAFLKKQET